MEEVPVEEVPVEEVPVEEIPVEETPDEDTVLGSGSFEAVLVTEDLGSPDSDDLFAGYVEQIMTEGAYEGGLSERAYMAPRRSYLNRTERLLFDAFELSAKAAASGSLDSGWFLYDVGTLLGKNTFTYAEMGLPAGATQTQMVQMTENKVRGKTPRTLFIENFIVFMLYFSTNGCFIPQYSV